MRGFIKVTRFDGIPEILGIGHIVRITPHENGRKTDIELPGEYKGVVASEPFEVVEQMLREATGLPAPE